MAAAIDIRDPAHPKRVAIVASNPAVSEPPMYTGAAAAQLLIETLGI